MNSLNIVTNLKAGIAFAGAHWLGVMVLVFGVIVLVRWMARRWSNAEIMAAQAVVSVAQAVVIVLLVMQERRWQQQASLQRSPTLQSQVLASQQLSQHPAMLPTTHSTPAEPTK